MNDGWVMLVSRRASSCIEVYMAAAFMTSATWKDGLIVITKCSQIDGVYGVHQFAIRLKLFAFDDGPIPLRYSHHNHSLARNTDFQRYGTVRQTTTETRHLSTDVTTFIHSVTCFSPSHMLLGGTIATVHHFALCFDFSHGRISVVLPHII